MPRALLAVAAVLLVALPACNALVNFDPEGQPCNPQAATEAEKCLEGYVCQDGTCRASAAPAEDAGLP